DVDGGEGSKTVLKGKVRTIRRNLDRISVTVADAAAGLAALRPSATYEKQSAAQVIKKLVSDASVQTGDVDIDLGLPAYVAHPGRTAAEHIAMLAALGGAIAYSGAD